MKPFDKAAAMRGARVCTRDGREARILCFDSGGVGYNEAPLPITAEIFSDRGSATWAYRENGMIDADRKTCYDLMMADEDYLEKLDMGEYPPAEWVDTATKPYNTPETDHNNALNKAQSPVTSPSPIPEPASDTAPDPWDEFKRQAALEILKKIDLPIRKKTIESIVLIVKYLIDGLKSK